MAIAVLPFENLVRAQAQAERRELERLRAAGLVPDRENDEQSEPAPTRAADVVDLPGYGSSPHTTYNRVTHRFLAYAVSTLFVFAMWGLFALDLAR